MPPHYGWQDVLSPPSVRPVHNAGPDIRGNGVVEIRSTTDVAGRGGPAAEHLSGTSPGRDLSRGRALLVPYAGEEPVLAAGAADAELLSALAAVAVPASLLAGAAGTEEAASRESVR